MKLGRFCSVDRLAPKLNGANVLNSLWKWRVDQSIASLMASYGSTHPRMCACITALF